jgi:3-dehydroquinate dehydratase
MCWKTAPLSSGTTRIARQRMAARRPRGCNGRLCEELAARELTRPLARADMDSFDFKMRKPEQVRQSVMEKLKKHGKGIVLVHDFQRATAEAAMDLLNDLKAGGYKIVFMQPKYSVTTIASYDEAILKQLKGPMPDTRPTSSVVRTISE